MKTLILPMICAVMLPSCAFVDGDPWGQVDFRLSGALQAGSRLDGNGCLRTTTNYLVCVERLEVRVASLSVQLEPAGTEIVEFDPADPPEGYSLCHNGHCHADDGRLVDYEEIATESLEGGTTGGQQLVRVVDDTFELNLDALSPLELGDCGEDCYLEPGELTTVQLTVSQIALEGVVFDSLEGSHRRLPAEGVSFQGTLPLEEAFRQAIVGSVGEGQPIGVRITVSWSLGGSLFDDVDWALALSESTAETITDIAESEAISTALRDQIEQGSNLTVSIERFDP